MNLKPVTFDNFLEAIEIQNDIFPHEDGTLNILSSLDRDLFMKATGLFYPDDKVKYYIAYVDKKPVGITGLYSENNINEAWLAWFGILPEFRNCGYGRQLLEETIKLAKNRNYKTLRLYTDKIGNAKAIKLYEKLGFIGEKYFAEKLAYDCWIYSKRLCEDNVELWNNKNLNLSYQSELDHMDKTRIHEIRSIYENLNK